MRKVLGIIAEYNPFHNGHFYHLDYSKQISNSDYVICIISGNFVQRGNTSIINKWAKTKMALLNGSDLVIELPTVYAISSAENFAYGSIKILDMLNIVNTISFGSELCDINILNKIANIFYDEPKEYINILTQELKKGISFPKARENAVLQYLSNFDSYSNILSKPNNILAIEYLKALRKLRSNIIPMAVKREKVYYNDNFVVDEYASATAIRDLLKHSDFDSIRKVVPKSCYSILKEEIENGRLILDLSYFEKEILYTLRKMSVSDIAKLPDVSEGLENAIKNAANSCNTLYELLNILHSKRYTKTRLQRILLYALLGFTKREISLSKKNLPYIRVLGFNDKGQDLLSDICRRNPKLSVITSVKKFMDESPNKFQKDMLEKDIMATNIYSLGYKKDSWANLDYTNRIIKL